jgi:hypothetical protein
MPVTTLTLDVFSCTPLGRPRPRQSVAVGSLAPGPPSLYPSLAPLYQDRWTSRPTTVPAGLCPRSVQPGLRTARVLEMQLPVQEPILVLGRCPPTSRLDRTTCRRSWALIRASATSTTSAIRSPRLSFFTPSHLPLPSTLLGRLVCRLLPGSQGAPPRTPTPRTPLTL